MSGASYLPRLSDETYCGNAVVHWVLTTQDRKQGWLTERFHGEFRELLLHTCTREQLVCPVYCLMPDHIHMVWMGMVQESDQKNAMRFFRTYLNRLVNVRLNHQAYDHVLRAHERKQHAFAQMSDYVLNNPVRKGLVSERREWPYSGAIVCGYPDLNPGREGFWEIFWRTYHQLRRHVS